MRINQIVWAIIEKKPGKPEKVIAVKMDRTKADMEIGLRELTRNLGHELKGAMYSKREVLLRDL